MKRLIFAGLAFAGLLAPAPASAADLTNPLNNILGGSTKDAPANTWTGYYVGINGGYGWDSKMNFNDAYTQTGSFVADLQTGAAPSGWFGGLSAGADWQLSPGSIVLGVETDIDLADIQDNSAVTATCTGSCIPGPTFTAHSTVDWFGTLRGRIGLPIGSNLLPYFTGGLAYGGVSTRAINSTFINLSQDTTRVGYALGGGVTYQMSPGWSLSTEYLHIDLGENPLTLSGTDITPGVTVTPNKPDNQLDIVRLVLKYKIGADLSHPTN